MSDDERAIRNGTAMRRSGYALTLLRKLPDGHWRLARDANLVTASY
jgi:ketosteroid isomerase-like protein